MSAPQNHTYCQFAIGQCAFQNLSKSVCLSLSSDEKEKKKQCTIKSTRKALQDTAHSQTVG